MSNDSDNAGAELFAELTQDPSWDGSLPLDAAASLVALHFAADGVSYEASDLMSKRLIQNPFGDVRTGEEPQPTTIAGALQFSLPQAGQVSVVVFDVQGRKVRTLLDGESGAGLVSLVWDRREDSGRSAPSGMYFARITGPGVEEVRKIGIAR